MRGLSKPAEQTGSLIKHPPTAAAEVSDCKRRPVPHHPSPPSDSGAAAPLPRSLHASASRGFQLFSAAGHQKALCPAPQKHSSGTMQTRQYLQFPQEREFTVTLCISVVWFLLSQTLARDKVNASGQVTPLCQQAAEQERSFPWSGNRIKPGRAPGPPTPTPSSLLCARAYYQYFYGNG